MSLQPRESHRLRAARLALTLLLLAVSAHSKAIEESAARDLAAGCAACHGTGDAARPPMPSLAGYQRDSLIAAMQGYKRGTRQGTVMPQIAKGYTDAQIDALGGWFGQPR